MQKLARDIKEQDFKNVYLLTGEEDYLRKQYRTDWQVPWQMCMTR